MFKFQFWLAYMCIFKEFKGAFKLPDSTVICLMVKREGGGTLKNRKGGVPLENREEGRVWWKKGGVNRKKTINEVLIENWAL